LLLLSGSTEKNRKRVGILISKYPNMEKWYHAKDRELNNLDNWHVVIPAIIKRESHGKYRLKRDARLKESRA
jgi:hypothetical protein